METVVFLHGWGSGPQNKQLLINWLSKKYHVIAPNLSDLTDKKDFSWEKFADNLDKFIGKRKVYLVGVSLGGGLALAYSAFYHKKVRAVVTCEPAGIKIKRNIIISAFLFLKMTTRALFYPEGVKIVSRVRFSFLKECLSHPKELYTQLKLVLEKDLEKPLSRIKSPVYILWGKSPDLLPLWMGERLHQGIPNSKFNPKFSDKNHLWCLFEQKKLARGILKFFDTHPPGEGKTAEPLKKSQNTTNL